MSLNLLSYASLPSSINSGGSSSSGSSQNPSSQRREGAIARTGVQKGDPHGLCHLDPSITAVNSRTEKLFDEAKLPPSIFFVGPYWLNGLLIKQDFVDFFSENNSSIDIKSANSSNTLTYLLGDPDVECVDCSIQPIPEITPGRPPLILVEPLTFLGKDCIAAEASGQGDVLDFLVRTCERLGLREDQKPRVLGSKPKCNKS